MSAYETVIGLEVHVHLATESKLFSPAPVRYGDAPNHAVDPIDLGLPGVLPVMNERVVELGLRAALATHCTIHGTSVFARKNYFYPDLPKGYQISQFEEPLATAGWLEIRPEGAESATRVGITRIHIEEDAGKSIHDSAVAGGGSHVDLNRAGVPLLEIVSEPDMRSAAEAGAYLRTLHQLLRYVGVTDGDLEKGQFRCDANVSIRPPGQEEFGTRTELKNLNSFRFVEAAIEAEAARQAELLDHGERVQQATMHFDAERGRTRVMRLKENSDDYRYFPDPDLIPLRVPRSGSRPSAPRYPSSPPRSARASRANSGSRPTTHSSSPRPGRSPTSSKPRWPPTAIRRRPSPSPTGSPATCSRPWARPGWRSRGARCARRRWRRCCGWSKPGASPPGAPAPWCPSW